MKYTKKDIYEGMKLKCIRTFSTNRWRVNRVYTTTKDKFGEIILVDDLGIEWRSNLIKDFLNDYGHVYFKEENNMEEFKVGDLVEVVKNSMYARNEFDEYYKKGDKAIVTGLGEVYIHLGENMAANLVKREDIKKVETTPELTEYEEELVLRLAEAINRKDNYLTELENLKYKLNEMDYNYEEVSKEIKEISKKLFTK
ncbi:hypothetical protein RG007_004980 [Vibrio parahaemolyticus]|nr:hypothetical protein [Vibrio parahaemolyticus]